MRQGSARGHVSVFPAPPVRGVGRTGGFKLMVEDRGDLGLTDPSAAGRQPGGEGRRSIRSPRKLPLLIMQPNVFRANAPQLYVDMNRTQCMTMGVPLADAFNTLQVYLGSLYVNDFNLFGRTWQVIVQADARSATRSTRSSSSRSATTPATWCPSGPLADVREVNGPLILTRYNMYPAAAINGNPGPGVSSRQAIDLMQRLADRELLPSMRYEWIKSLSCCSSRNAAGV